MREQGKKRKREKTKTLVGWVLQRKLTGADILKYQLTLEYVFF
jgi:hypothetical protein